MRIYNALENYVSYTAICSCTSFNIYIRTQGFSSTVTVKPLIGFRTGGGVWLLIRSTQSFNLTPGATWTIAMRMSPVPSVSGVFLYAGGVEAYGALYVRSPLKSYNLTVNCP